MRETLVLNASFEPLSTVTLHRAVVLVLQDKAVVEQAHPGLRVRAAAMELPVPRVIRLCRYVRVPFRRHAPWSRRGVLVRDQHRCAYCDRRASTVDHVTPRSHGGCLYVVRQAEVVMRWLLQGRVIRRGCRRGAWRTGR
jgi:5-methylcytosine-specific restriction endonuclease McrA